MAKRTTTEIPQVKRDGAMSCMRDLFNVHDSWQACLNYNLISDVLPTDHHGKLQHVASFDNECRKIHKHAVHQDGTQQLVKRHGRSKMDGEIFNLLVQVHRRERKKNRRGHLDCGSNHQADSIILSHYFRSFFDLDKCNDIDKMKAKSFVDQLFLARKFAHKSGMSPFSDAKEVLSSKHDQYMGLFQVLDSVVARRINSSATEIVGPPKKHEQVDCGCSSLASRTLSKTTLHQKVTPFSLRGMKKKLKNSFQGTTAVGIMKANKREEEFCKKNAKLEQGSTVSNMTQRVSKRLALTGVQKHEFDINLEAIRRLQSRLKKVQAEEAKTSPKTLRHILSSSDHELSFIGSRRDSHYSSVSSQTSNRVISSFKTEDRAKGSSQDWRPDKMVHDTENTNSQGPETRNRNTFNSIQDSVSEPLSATDVRVKHQEEHQSPVSVLEPFSTENGLTPPGIGISSEKGSDDGTQQKLQPIQLDFEECSRESSPKNDGVSSDLCIEEQTHLSHYVNSVLQASCLDWTKLSEITFPSEELLQDSLFDEAHTHCYFNPKLLFDYINEVLIEMHQSHFSHTL